MLLNWFSFWQYKTQFTSILSSFCFTLPFSLVFFLYCRSSRTSSVLFDYKKTAHLAKCMKVDGLSRYRSTELMFKMINRWFKEKAVTQYLLFCKESQLSIAKSQRIKCKRMLNYNSSQHFDLQVIHTLVFLKKKVSI